MNISATPYHEVYIVEYQENNIHCNYRGTSHWNVFIFLFYIL